MRKEERKYNPNLLFLNECYSDNKIGAILEGSSRSGKTWASIHFIIQLCASVEPDIITIVKETYASFKTTLYNDFAKILDQFGLYNPFNKYKEIRTFNIYKTKIQFIGADDPDKFKGLGSDFIYFNEMMEIPRGIFDQAEQRCRSFWWGDYNPAASLHYIYDNVIPRDDVGFLKTTWADNPYISDSERRKILSYEPTSYNIGQGTADEYMWKVYGLGERMGRTGLVFPNVNWIDKFPDNLEKIGYGFDIGYTHDPSALVRAGVDGNNIYLELLIYEPTENAQYAAPLINAVAPDLDYMICDSADPVFISDLNAMKIKTYAIKKFSGSIKYGIGLLKSYKINIVKNEHAKKEAENYAWRTINGISLDEPIDKFNHFWDASRYIAMFKFRKKL